MIVFAWRGFPQYAARCVGAFVKSVDERVFVIATRPNVPIAGMEEVCGCQVVWIEAADERSLVELCGEVPRALVVNGWCVPAFNRFVNEARRVKATIVATIDNNYIPSFKEFLKKLRFKLFLRNRFDGFIVPGNSGKKLLRYYGVKDEVVSTGMYSADHSLFGNGKPLQERDKKIIYVGQFIERKNVVRMVNAFKKANDAMGRVWRLELYGSGVLRDKLIAVADESVEIHDFVQPESLAPVYRSARCFCLLSNEEHWGVVVHEAALSGCMLLLSDRVGAAEDFVGDKNGVMVPPDDDDAIIAAFKRIMSMDDRRLEEAQAESLRLSGMIGLDTFVSAVEKFI